MKHEYLVIEDEIIKGIKHDMDKASIKEIKIPEGVTEIGNYVFADCENLKCVEIPASVVKIKILMLRGGKNIASVRYGGTLAQWCTLHGGGNLMENAESVVLAGEGNLDLKKMTTLEIPEGIAKIGFGAFLECESLTSVRIPASVKSIGTWAFKRCEKIDNVWYGGTLAQWCALDGGGNLMENTKSVVLAGESNLDLKKMTTLEIPECVTKIEHFAFAHCENLVSVEIPANVKSIDKLAFAGCNRLASAKYGGTLAQWCALEGGENLTGTARSVMLAGENNLDLKKLATLEIPEGVTAIGNGAFFGCECIKSVKIPASVTSIEGWAFYGCEGLESVEIPESVTSIGVYAFSDCASLENVTIPASVTSIGSEAFFWCERLDSVRYGGTLEQWCALDSDDYLTEDAKNVILTGEGNLNLNKQKTLKIPEGITRIRKYAFSYCESLESVEIPSSVKFIGKNAFEGCENLVNVDIPGSVKLIGSGAFNGCKNLVSVAIPDSVKRIGTCAFSGCESLANVAMPEGMKVIGPFVFENCKSLENMTIPDKVTYIGRYAFAGCEKLASVTIPKGVTCIGSSAFARCESLASVAIPGSVGIIRKDTFLKCKSLESVEIADGIKEIMDCAFYCCALTSVTIPESVESIGEGAFCKCRNLASVDIPRSVTSIEASAFWECDSLENVKYAGTKTQWNQIHKEHANIGSPVIHCADGDITTE